jgi:hypothetical protein
VSDERATGTTDKGDREQAKAAIVKGDHYIPSRSNKKRCRPRGCILFEDLPRSPKAEAVRADILDRLRQHDAEDTLPRGGRGLFYDLRPHGLPGNPRGVTYTKHPIDKGRNSMQATPEYVTEQLALMRRVWNPETEEWLVPESWIADSRMPDPLAPTETSDAVNAAHVIASYIRRLWLARQAGQPAYLELRCEAADLMPRVGRVALPYGVHVYSGGGSDGLKPKKEAAERAARRGVPTIIGHLADYDEDGGDIADAFAEDALAFTDWHRDNEDASGSLTIERLGLTLAQAREHELLDDDGKAELDGLPVAALDSLVRNWVEKYLDPDIARAVIQAEPKMRTEVARHAQRIVKKQPSLTQPDTDEDWAWARNGWRPS